MDEFIMKKVSIIVPVYNSEKYLTQCIDSILNQTYKNIELILVDDCSPDKSFEICNDFAKKDSRIRYFKKEKNEGVSEARNFGIQKAKGDYVCFVDGDDFVEIDYVKKLLNKAEKDNLDLTFCRYSGLNDNVISNFWELSLERFAKEKQYQYLFYKAQESDLLNKAPQNKKVDISIITFGICWRVLYKKEFLVNNNIYFNKDLFYCEDVIFVVKCLEKTNKVDVIDDFLYNYRQSADSITRNFNFKLVEQTEKVCSIFLDLAKDNLTDNQVKCFYYDRGLALLYKVLSFGTKNNLKELTKNSFVKKCFSKENYKAYKATLVGFKAKFSVTLLQHKMFWLYKMLKKIFKKS